MEHKLSHTQRLLQRMSLTPQMRQSIQLLGMSVKDLSEYIDAAITQNPFLQKLMDKKRADSYSKSHAYPIDDGISDKYSSRSQQKVDPRMTLVSQLRMLGLKDKSLEIAEYLIYEMDDNGYITIDPEEAASDLSASQEEVRECLEVIQSMEPPGIGAHDMRECLQLQLERAHKKDSLEYEIVSSFLNELAKDDIEKISKGLKVDKDKIRVAINNIKKLNPRPASSLLKKEADYVMPELVAHVENKGVRLEINRGALPQLKLYNPYEKDLDIIKDPEARTFLKENMDAAKGLIDNLKRREETVCKVASFILSFQLGALSKGGQDLKSLTIGEVAKALDFHPSTISRAVSHKYVEIDGKVACLKDFLSHSIEKANGETTSKDAVKKKIATLVKEEDTRRPLSDKEIFENLEREGITIKRRTVAKYRDSLRILPTYLRKRAKQA